MHNTLHTNNQTYLYNTGAQGAVAGVGHVVEGASQQGKLAAVPFFPSVGFEDNVPNARATDRLVLASVDAHLYTQRKEPGDAETHS